MTLCVMFNKFTNRLQKVLQRAQELADFSFRKKVEIEDVFLSLAYEKGCIAYEILSHSGGLQSEALNLVSKSKKLSRKTFKTLFLRRKLINFLKNQLLWPQIWSIPMLEQSIYCIF